MSIEKIKKLIKYFCDIHHDHDRAEYMIDNVEMIEEEQEKWEEKADSCEYELYRVAANIKSSDLEYILNFA